MFISLLKKELFIEFRSREVILSMLIFGLSIILAFAFTTNVSKIIVLNYAPGMFWIMILFVTTLGVHRSFTYEKNFDAFSLLISAPIDRGLIYLSKWISGTIFLTVMEIIIIIPFFKFLLLDLPSNFILFSLTSILINFAIMSVASLVAGISMRANFSEVLVPILFFPLVSPVIIAATKISSGVLSGDPYQLWQIWLLIIVSVIVIFPLAGYTLFDFITEE
ncbi:MAG: ABC transporter permease [Pelagibacteraceae bacterium]|jgi:heme exporter protein B|nr:ABC transporter permease [Candidatus Neomarinimicrobiota bacterium]MBT5595988.1 ABC transporter permease [Flavobacteriaceae bacterium]MBT6197564.1 ABC transporter permease [Pelagibacteraceae bacterium]